MNTLIFLICHHIIPIFFSQTWMVYSASCCLIIITYSLLDPWKSGSSSNHLAEIALQSHHIPGFSIKVFILNLPFQPLWRFRSSCREWAHLAHRPSLLSLPSLHSWILHLILCSHHTNQAVYILCWIVSSPPYTRSCQCLHSVCVFMFLEEWGYAVINYVCIFVELRTIPAHISS